MTDDNDPIWPGGGGAQPAKPRAFSREEMITCSDCLRANAPTRSTCLYCSTVLPGAGAGSEASRVESEEPGTEVSSPTGEGATVVPEALAAAVPPRKVCALEFSEDSVSAVTIGAREKLSARWADFVLIVTGRLIVNRLEIEQPKSRRNKKPAERRELSSDEAVLDILTAERDGGWRIGASSFDFSCLGEKKTALASENFGTLINSLRERAVNAAFDDAYMRERRALAEVWPIQERTESQGWRRAGAGKFSTTTATIHDNETQFTHYSRMRHDARLRELLKSV